VLICSCHRLVRAPPTPRVGARSRHPKLVPFASSPLSSQYPAPNLWPDAENRTLIDLPFADDPTTPTVLANLAANTLGNLRREILYRGDSTFPARADPKTTHPPPLSNLQWRPRAGRVSSLLTRLRKNDENLPTWQGPSLFSKPSHPKSLEIISVARWLPHAAFPKHA